MNKQLFDFSVDLMQAILWQYNDATRLQSLLEQKQAWFDENQKDFWQNWYNDVFNLQTCNDFGLAVWAIILELPIIIQSTPVEPSRPTWGFSTPHRNFDRGNFFSGSSGAQVISPADARIALRLRYYQLTTRASVTELNSLLADVFADYGLVFVQDNLDASITYIFTFTPSAELITVMAANDLFVRPAGVSVNYELVYFVFNGIEQVYNLDEPVIVSGG